MPSTLMDTSGPKRWSHSFLSRVTLRRLILFTGIIASFGVVRYLLTYVPDHQGAEVYISRPDSAPVGSGATEDNHGEQDLWDLPPEPCVGPRGKLIPDSPDDQLQPQRLKASYPTPFTGSYDALGLPQEWLTLDGRYGPYGLRSEDSTSARLRSAVEWDRVDWGDLQHACQVKNAARFPSGGKPPFNASETRFHLRPNDTDADSSPSWFSKLRNSLGFHETTSYTVPKTGRTALLLRTYDGYEYTNEDMLNIRSLVSEAGLQSGGEYTVALFLNIRNSSKDIWSSEENYNKAIDDANVPAEFRNLVVLWDEPLLQSWYPKIEEHSIYYQITQATQLFGLFYPEFDFYWQLEMDLRSLGHAATLLRSIDRFAQQEPRKQSWERASYRFLPVSYGSYPEFFSAVNATLDGGASIWGPVSIPEISRPIGPSPPVSDPRDDDFEWGVGEPADLIVTNACTWVSRMRTWPFRSWLMGPFSLGLDTPRITCPPAIQRASRQLLLVVHEAQAKLGLAVPSEATLPSFAAWHGLKISEPPLPHFRGTEMNERVKEVFYNGGKPGESVRLASKPETEEAAEQLKKDILDYLIEVGGHEGNTEELVETWSTGLETIPYRDEKPLEEYRGFASGEAAVNQDPHVSLTDELTWWWRGSFPRRIMKAWSKGKWTGQHESKKSRGEEQDAAPEPLVDAHTESAGVLVEEDGDVWAPAAWLHPVKTN